MKILIFTPGYPNEYSETYPFIKQLVSELCCQGHSCFVIDPFSITSSRKYLPEIERVTYEKGGLEIIIRPRYIRVSSRGFLHKVSKFMKNKAYLRGAESIGIKPDVVYCHFWVMGYVALDYVRKYKLPLFVATGESDIRKISGINKTDISRYVSGVISVSTKNKVESIEMGLVSDELCKVFPNAIDSTIFYKMDKSYCRSKLGFPLNEFIIIFVGWFIERKGPIRVAKAISEIKERNVYSIFIGSGKENPKCDNIVFKGAVPHNEIPMYLNCADAFVLPTHNEGCSNAIVEAMACGLPIISSNLPFNWDVLDETNSILVNPDEIEQIKNAIVELRDNKVKRDLFSNNSIKKAQNLSIASRASNIVNFINERINDK